MARLTSPKYLVILGIVLGFVFLTHTSLSAQDSRTAERKWSDLSHREMFAFNMKYNLKSLDECIESQARLAKSKADELYQVYLSHVDKYRKAKAACVKADSEFKAAERAVEEAQKEYDFKNKECEEKKGKNPQKDYKEIRECVDFANFIMNVVGPRRKTLDKRREDLLLNNNLYEKSSLDIVSSARDYDTEVGKIISRNIGRVMEDNYGGGLYPPDVTMRRTPNELKDRLDKVCDEIRLKRKYDIEQANRITVLLVEDCQFDDADRFVASLPEFAGISFDGKSGKTELEKPISAAREREDDAARKYEEGQKYYRPGQVEEKAGRVSQARDLYRNAIAKLQEGRAISKCDSRIQQFDKVILTLNTALARLASAQKGSCEDLSGAWGHKTIKPDCNTSTWNITKKAGAKGHSYEATESGCGNAHAKTVTFTGKQLRIDWSISSACEGYYYWNLDPACKSGKGRLVFTSTTGQCKGSFESNVERK